MDKLLHLAASSHDAAPASDGVCVLCVCISACVSVIYLYFFTAADKADEFHGSSIVGQGAHEVEAAEAEEDLKRLSSLLSRFYAQYNPTKLSEVEDLARVFRGKEHVLNERLRSSYRADLTNFVSRTEAKAASEKAAPPVKKQASRPSSLPPQPQNLVFTASDKTGAHEAAAAEAEEDLQRLTSLLSRFYAKHNPTKLAEVEDLARVFRGKEHVLNERLRSSYRADLTNFETGTEGKAASEKAAPPQAWRPASLPPVTEESIQRPAGKSKAEEEEALLDAIRQIKAENPDFTVERVWTTIKEKGIVVSESRVYTFWPQVGGPTNQTEAEAKTAAEVKAKAEAEAKAAAEYTENAAAEKAAAEEAAADAKVVILTSIRQCVCV